MDLLSTVRKTGSRGGVNFSWDDVATSAHRENYLGHSLKAPVGRWQKGRDLNWYAKADAPAAAGSATDETEEGKRARERREELRQIKEAEEDAISKALGLPIKPRNLAETNAVGVEGSNVGGVDAVISVSDVDKGQARKHWAEGHNQDLERRHHHRRRWSRDRDRKGERDRSRSCERRRDRYHRERDQYHHGRQRGFERSNGSDTGNEGREQPRRRRNREDMLPRYRSRRDRH